MANGLMQGTVLWQVNIISNSDPLQLGIVGLIRFLPALVMSFVGGAVADAFNRRTVLLAAQTVPAAATMAMLGAIATGNESMPLMYAFSFILGAASSFENPSRQALLPLVVPRHLFLRANTFNSMVSPLAMTLGPAVAGYLIHMGDVQASYTGYLVFAAIAAAFVISLPLPKQEHTGTSGLTLASVREGLDYVWSRPALIGVMTLDMFAVIFGGAKALLPIYATSILKVDALGFGILNASLEAGAILMSLILIAVPLPKKTGRTILASVAAFGLFTMLFGLSTWFPLSVLIYMFVGMSDQLSLVQRQNMVQMLTPDHLRGRVSAVAQVFIGASNQIGGLESGIVATFTNTVFAVVSGGAACIGVVGLMAWFNPDLREYEAAERIGAKPRPKKPSGETAAAS